MVVAVLERAGSGKARHRKLSVAAFERVVALEGAAALLSVAGFEAE